MSYKNKTYVIFDADNDMWAYGFMNGWRLQDHLEFDFHDAHDLRPLSQTASEETVKRRLRERFSSSKQAIVLVGNNTKNLYRFVRWEIDTAMSLNLPIVAVNLNKLRRFDETLCPPILRDYPAVHVSFQMKIIQFALDDFAAHYLTIKAGKAIPPYRYTDDVYKQLGL